MISRGPLFLDDDAVFVRGLLPSSVQGECIRDAPKPERRGENRWGKDSNVGLSRYLCSLRG
jgi:hypothetical protein